MDVEALLAQICALLQRQGRVSYWLGLPRPGAAPCPRREGFDTADLQEAKALLDELGG
jgi:hypothetical protein